MNKTDKKLLIGLIILAIAYISFVVPIYIAPDEQVPDLFSSNLLKTGQFSQNIPEDNLTIHGFNTFPDGFNLNPETNKIVPISFPGFIYTASLFKLAGINFQYISVIVSILTLSLIYVITRYICKRKIAALITLLIAVSPIYFHWSTIGYQDILSFFTLIIMIYFYVKLKDNSVKYMVLGIFLTIFVMMRYTNAIFIPIILALIFYNKHNKINLRAAILFSISYAIFFLPVLIFNKINYNAYITIPDTVNTGNEFNYISYYVFTSQILNALKVKLQLLAEFSMYLSPLLILTICAITYIFVNRSLINKKLYGLTLISFLMLIIAFLFFTADDKSFYWKSAHYSFYRYLLPVMSMILIPITSMLVKKRKEFTYSLLGIVIILSVLFITTLNFNSGYIHNSKIELLDNKNDILSLTQKDSIIITNYYDKIIYPERKIVRLNQNTTKGNLTKENMDYFLDYYDNQIKEGKVYIVIGPDDPKLIKNLDIIKDKNYIFDTLYTKYQGYNRLIIYKLNQKNETLN